MSRVVFVGDVHGCLAELDELLGLLELSTTDRLVFLGDLVDRGPDSVGVVRRVRELCRQHPGSLSIAGNHEEKALRLRDRGKPGRAWHAQASDDDWAFLDELPLVHREPDLNAVAVHGGFFPAFFEAYGELGELSTSWRTDRGKRADRQRRFLRLRCVDARGNMVALDKTLPEHAHWSALYDGREGFGFFGHHPQLDPCEPLRSPHALGLDTGCCFGGALTAAVVSAPLPAEPELVRVAAHERYAEPFGALDA